MAARSLINLKPARVWLEEVRFQVADNLNQDAPLRVDIVIPYEEELLKKISGWTAQEYFEKVDQLRKDGTGKIDIFTWEVVPGQILEAQPIHPSKTLGVGVLIFAHYATPGEHRWGLHDEREIKLILEKIDFKVEKIR